MKKAAVFMAMAVLLGAAAYAQGEGLRMYAKLTVGYQSSAVMLDDPDDNVSVPVVHHTSGLEVVPTFGVTPPVDVQGTFGRLDFAVEGLVGLTFSSNGATYYTDNAVVIAPGATFVANYYFPQNFPGALQKLVPYSGLGFSVPISIVSVRYAERSEYHGKDWSQTHVGFKANWLFGARYDCTPHLSALAEANLAFGSLVGWSARGGIIWRF